MREPSQRVEVIIPVRTLMVVLAFAFVVVLAVLSLDTLLSIFLAAILALGLDPVVSGLVRRGWPRGRAALFVFFAVGVAVAALVLLALGPVWDEVKQFVNQLPTYWNQFTQSDFFNNITSTAGADDKIRAALKDLAAGLPDAANTLLGIAGSIFGSVLSLVTLSFLALFLMME